VALPHARASDTYTVPPGGLPEKPRIMRIIYLAYPLESDRRDRPWIRAFWAATSLLLYPFWRVYYYCKFWVVFNVAWKVKPPKA
jgi:hypothetical protein